MFPCLILLHICLSASIEPPSSSDIYTKVAFFGDQGLTPESKAVLSMVKQFNPDFVVQLGDFDYENNPRRWIDQFDQYLGKHVPVFAVIGNHDIVRWWGKDGYQSLLLKRLKHTSARHACVGDFGVNTYCEYKGMGFVLSGVGTLGSGHIDFIDQAMDTSKTPWKFCSWHKNQRLFQIGGKKDEVGFEAYEMCLKHGAFLLSGHEHSYARTHLMSSFKNQEIASKDDVLRLEKGKSFSVVSGLGGISINQWNDQLVQNEWWAAYASSNNNATYGTLLCSFPMMDLSKLAECEFKDINGNVFDSFQIEAAMPARRKKKKAKLHAFVVEK